MWREQYVERKILGEERSEFEGKSSRWAVRAMGSTKARKRPGLLRLHADLSSVCGARQLTSKSMKACERHDAQKPS